MNEKELAEHLVKRGIVEPRFRELTESMIRDALRAKDQSAVEQKILSRYTPIHNDPTRILGLMFGDLPDKAKAEPQYAEPEADDAETESEPKVPTPEEEWETEERDRTEQLELQKQLAELSGDEPRPMAEPNDPRFDRHPSVFDGPYRGHEEYKNHTFASVYRESRETHVTMHEICRRLGLQYEFLLI